MPFFHQPLTSNLFCTSLMHHRRGIFEVGQYQVKEDQTEESKRNTRGRMDPGTKYDGLLCMALQVNK